MPREHDVHEQKYLCSNPNCKSIFYRPKVITYHVCPDCQTLVNINEFADEEEIQIVLAARQPLERKPNAPESKNVPKQNAIALEIKTALVEETSETESKLAERKDMNKPELAAEFKQMPISTHRETAVPNQTPNAAEVEITNPSSSPTGCQYGFGYLSQREKGEGIPDGCIECAQSLSCMLSEYYKAEKSVKEIKKWYGF